MGIDSSASRWGEESQRLIELALCGYEIALTALPTAYPMKREFWFGKVTISDKADVERLEREISDAFFLRLKSIVEAQAKRLPGSKPNWQTAGQLLRSMGVDEDVLSADDRKALGDFCALRNCIAHNDGRVDSEAARRIPQLQEGSDVWMDRETLREWFSLCGRTVQAVAATL